MTPEKSLSERMEHAAVEAEAFAVQFGHLPDSMLTVWREAKDEVAALEERNEALEAFARAWSRCSGDRELGRGGWYCINGLKDMHLSARSLLSTHQGQGTEEASSEFSVRPTGKESGYQSYGVNRPHPADTTAHLHGEGWRGD